MTLTNHQKNFILENFFKKEEFPGWKNIANKLLDNGKCIVAGENCIWVGGVGNFISTSPTKDAFGCLEYTFSLQYFMTSKWFQEIYKQYLQIITEELKEKEQKVTEIEQLITYQK